MVGTTTSSSAMDTGAIREFSISVPSHSIVTRNNGLHEEIKVENVPAAKPVQTGRRLSYSPGLAVINLDLTNQVKELETHRAKSLTSQVMTGKMRKL